MLKLQQSQISAQSGQKPASLYQSRSALGEDSERTESIGKISTDQRSLFENLGCLYVEGPCMRSAGANGELYSRCAYVFHYLSEGLKLRGRRNQMDLKVDEDSFAKSVLDSLNGSHPLRY